MFDVFLAAPGLLLAVFFGSLIQRIAGMGFGIAVSGFALALFDPFTAVYVSAIVGAGVTIVTTLQMWRHVVWSAVWPIVAPVFLFMCLGFALAYAYGQMPPVRALFQLLGILAILVVLRNLLGRRGGPSTRSWIAHPWVGGSFTGFLSGTAGMPGPTIAPYFAQRQIVGAAFVASITPVFIVTSTSRIVLGTGDAIGQTEVNIAILGCVIGVVGVFAGAGLARFVSTKNQRRLILALIFASGARLTYALIDGLWTYFRDSSMV